MNTSSFIFFIGAVLVMGACSSPSANNKKPKYTEPLSPEQALQSFHLNKDFHIEVFAAEPYVLDPVDMAFDENGNIFVVEMPDYPYQPEPGKEAGTIRLLVDSNHDGRIDKSVIFADHLSEATSILPWKGGLIVTAAPDILYLKDTTGDLKADIKEVLFTGFFKSNQEAQVTNLRFGIDNWIYANNDGQAGEVSSGKDPKADSLRMRGSDFRFRMETGKFELETGTGQFGQTLNDWGHRFFTENTLHIRQSVIPWRYLHRHEYLPGTKADINISDHDPIMYQETPPPYWRAARTAARNRIYKEQHLDRVEYAEDHFTGSSGGTVYDAEVFPKEYYGNIFTGDVAGNLVHRDVMLLHDTSAVYTASRDTSEKDREFLASTDPWFRPVGFTTGPDGYLYLIDYYRQHIETPVSIPDSLKADMDFIRGSDMGRIYRITPKNEPAKKQEALPNLAKMTGTELVQLLAYPNQWWRLTAQRLLLERQDKSVIPALKSLFTLNQDPRARLHALYALEGLDALDASLVTRAMKDAHPGVREHGMILSERFPECLTVLKDGVHDASAHAALQATLSLGNFAATAVLPSLAEVTEKHVNDPWFRMAVLSSKPGSSIELLQLLVKRGVFFSQFTPQHASFVSDLSYITGMRNTPGETVRLLNILSSPSLPDGKNWQLECIKGLGKSLRSATRNKGDIALKTYLQKMPGLPDQEIKDSVQSMISLLK